LGTIGHIVTTVPPPDRPPSYDARAYWSDLHREGGLKAVGQSGLPESLNRWLYRIGRRNVTAFMAGHGLADLRGMTVLDVGTGTGFWLDVWRSLGASTVDGIDLVPAAVDALRVRFPNSTFMVGDIADPGSVPADGRYDAVMVMNVMLHITDEDRFSMAASNLARALRPGGRMLLAEPALTRPASVRPPKPGASSMARPLGRYRDAFESAGLKLVAVGPSTVVGANPIETDAPGFRWYAAAWKRVGKTARRWPRRAGVLGRGLALVDRVLMATGAAPSGKLILFERPSTTSRS
jgi:2-polyprenyl-3-methyl-5-hydroxy-6-metoxy-1,4-benzoquinol methylase